MATSILILQSVLEACRWEERIPSSQDRQGTGGDLAHASYPCMNEVVIEFAEKLTPIAPGSGKEDGGYTLYRQRGC